MKSLKLLKLLIVPCIFSAGCSDDDTSSTAHPIAQGEWKLVNVSNGFGGSSYDFEPGTIAWTFNDNNTLTVVNYNEDENAPDHLKSGTYNLHFETDENSPCGQNLFADIWELGCKTETQTQLVLSNSWVDGDVLTFSK